MSISFLPLLLSTAIAADLSILHAQHQSVPSSPLDSVLSLALHDPARLAFLSQKLTSIPIASGQHITQTSSYVLRVKLGSPPGQSLLLALDTSSDAAFVQCFPCYSCPSSTLFIPSNSTSYTTISCSSQSCTQFKGQQCKYPNSKNSPCTYTQQFGGDDSNFTAILSQDSLRLAVDEIPKFLFGCINTITGNSKNLASQGLLGLGRGPTSLLSQAVSLYHGVFSYCLPSFKSYYFSGSLRLGPVNQPKSVQYTPLLKNPHRPSLYYVNMTSVSVGKVLVALPAGSFSFDPMTGSGTVVDSGTVISRFVEPAYVAIRDEFRRQVAAKEGYSSLGAFDTCFNTDGVWEIPKVTIHMHDLDFELPAENTLIHSSETSLACLAMASAPDNVDSVVNVIASLQQQNVRVVIDVMNSRVGFARELCN